MQLHSQLSAVSEGGVVGTCDRRQREPADGTESLYPLDHRQDGVEAVLHVRVVSVDNKGQVQEGPQREVVGVGTQGVAGDDRKATASQPHKFESVEDGAPAVLGRMGVERLERQRLEAEAEQLAHHYVNAELLWGG